MGDRPEPGEIDEAELLGAIRRILDEGRRGAASGESSGRALYRAYARASIDDERHGNLAGLILYWITGGRGDREAVDLADEILNGSGYDPRRDKVYDLVHRLAAGEITWTEFARVAKKGLIPPLPHDLPVVPADALPLTGAKGTLEATLVEAGASLDGPSLEVAWRAFSAFARRPFAATPPLHVENDMCLFQWGVYDWGKGDNFECDLTRQFVLHDADDYYDHMEQVHLTLLLPADDSDLLNLGTGEIWSGDDLANWAREVEGLEAFAVISTKSPSGLRLDHFDV